MAMAEMVGEAQGLQFVYGDHYVFQVSQGNSLGLEESYSRFPLHPPAFFGSGHLPAVLSKICFFY
jgi:hypothetical protein